MRRPASPNRRTATRVRRSGFSMRGSAIATSSMMSDIGRMCPDASRAWIPRRRSRNVVPLPYRSAARRSVENFVMPARIRSTPTPLCAAAWSNSCNCVVVMRRSVAVSRSASDCSENALAKSTAAWMPSPIAPTAASVAPTNTLPTASELTLKSPASAWMRGLFFRSASPRRPVIASPTPDATSPRLLISFAAFLLSSPRRFVPFAALSVSAGSFLALSAVTLRRLLSSSSCASSTLNPNSAKMVLSASDMRHRAPCACCCARAFAASIASHTHHASATSASDHSVRIVCSASR